MSNLLSKIGSMMLFDWGTWLKNNANAGGNVSDFTWVANLYGYLTPILYAIMAVVAAAGSIYAIILGVKLAQAEDTSKRDEAKKHLITVLIAVAVTVALVIFFNEILPLIITSAIPVPDSTVTPVQP